MFLGSNITADGNCSHDTERCFFIGRKAVANLDSILKRRHITLLKMVHIVKAVILLVVMYGCASWTIKKAECQRIDAFDLWCWRRLLRFPWKARRSIQSILKEMSFRYLLEEQMPKLKLQAFGQLMWKVDSLENTLMLGKIEGRRKRGEKRMRWLEGITNSMGMSLCNSKSVWRTEKPDVLQSMGSKRVRNDWVTEQQ